MVSVDGATATALTSGTRLTTDGLYAITITGVGTYTESYTFRIGDEPITSCPTGQELVGGACQAITCPVGKELEGNDCVTITCDDGYELDGSDCVVVPVEKKTGCFGTVNFASPIIVILSALGAGFFFLFRKTK